ncbi:Hypothetical protein PHPALM_6312 [Phytophthora palmivora]|uniref:Chromo domain-containing protein n=1 Tax=Phytophthora palmivora TaxID=4796 RepID=A0A2P4YF55_9STRA|nr:Hypothetical protein PHPALM_6312 [Phytophthora palmivora]
MLETTYYARALTRKRAKPPRNVGGNRRARCSARHHSEFKQHRWNSSIKDYKVLTNWTGLESKEYSWEPLNSLATEVKVQLEWYSNKQDDTIHKYWEDNHTKFKKKITT